MNFQYESEIATVNAASPSTRKALRSKRSSPGKKDDEVLDYDDSEPLELQKHAHGGFTCDCTICFEQTKPEYHLDAYQNQLEVREYLYQGVNRDFWWLINHLLPSNDKIRGCEMILPDTVFFQRGKPRVIVKNDRQFCLMAVRQMTKLNLQSVYKDFSNVVRERKKDFSGPFNKLYKQNFAVQDFYGSESGNSPPSKQVILPTQAQGSGNYASTKDFTSENLRKDRMKRKSEVGPDMLKGVTDKSIYYRDVALIRYKNDGLVQVVNDIGFMNTFLRRANDEYWQSVSYIQTNIKSKLGCGVPIIIKFYAPLLPEDPEEEIAYNFRSLGDDVDLIRNDEYQYCVKQCYKMCYYIQKVYNFEILKMRAEFSKDENGTIWFFYASQITVRPLKGKGHLFTTKKLSYVNQQAKTNLIEELEKHQDQAKENNSQNIQKMYELMGNHYERIKENIGLKDVFENSDSDGETEKIFQKLRPQSPFKFKDLMKNNFDPRKFNRMIGKADKKLDHEQVKDIILYNKPITQHSKKKFEKPDFAELHDNMRLMHNYVQETNKTNNSTLQNSNKNRRVLSFKQRPLTAPSYKISSRRTQQSVGASDVQSQKQKAFFQISRGNYQFENHKNQPSTNVSSMRDIHKMYEPPIPKHLIPTNNPFYNKSLVSSTDVTGVTQSLKAIGGYDNVSAARQSFKKTSPRSLLNWINSPNTKRVQQRMANRISYLQFLSQNKNTLMSDVAALEQDETMNSEVEQKMNKLLLLAEDPKIYQQAVEEFKTEEEDKGYIKEDHLFDDKYIISERTFMKNQQQDSNI